MRAEGIVEKEGRHQAEGDIQTHKQTAGQIIVLANSAKGSHWAGCGRHKEKCLDRRESIELLFCCSCRHAMAVAHGTDGLARRAGEPRYYKADICGVS